MAELILTQEEEGTSWAKLDNETLGKIVKYVTFSHAERSWYPSENDKPFSTSDDIKTDMVLFSVTIALCCRFHDLKIRRNAITLEDINAGDMFIGDWKVTYERIDLSYHPKYIFRRLKNWLFKTKKYT
jgi:hypothetical protein